jgi:hypothetical protein
VLDQVAGSQPAVCGIAASFTIIKLDVALRLLKEGYPDYQRKYPQNC